MKIISKIKSLFSSEEPEEDASYPYRFIVIKWRDNAHRHVARSWRAKKLVYIEGGQVKKERNYFPGRAKIMSRTMNVPYYDETGGQNAPDVKTYAEVEPGVLNSR